MALPPEEFRCPISLELMSDPVILATGQTYDRPSIQRWLDAGQRTCPQTKQVLHDTKLIPNYALRSLICQWANANGVDLKEPAKNHLLATSPSSVGGLVERDSLVHLKARVDGLVKSLSSSVAQARMDALKKINSFAKEGKESRTCIVEAGGIASLSSLILSRHSQIEELILDTLLELSLDDENKVGLVAEGAVDAIIHVLTRGSIDVRVKAAGTLSSLARVDVNKATIGSRVDAIPALVKLVAEGNLRGKKEAMNALYGLCMYPENKARLVSAGVIPVLVAILIEGGNEPVEHAVTVLDFLSTLMEGRIAIMREAALPAFVRLLMMGSGRSREYTAALLWSLCSNSKKYTLQVYNAGAKDACLNLLQVGTSRAKRKAGLLLKAFQVCQQTH